MTEAAPRGKGIFLCGAVHAATRLALVSGQSGAEIENALDIATVRLSQESELDPRNNLQPSLIKKPATTLDN